MLYLPFWLKQLKMVKEFRTMAIICISVTGAKRLKDTLGKFWSEGMRQGLFSENDREGCSRDKRWFIWGSTAPFFPFACDTVATQSSSSCHLEKLNSLYIHYSLILLFTMLFSCSLDICWCLISYKIRIWIAFARSLIWHCSLQNRLIWANAVGHEC